MDWVGVGHVRYLVREGPPNSQTTTIIEIINVAVTIITVVIIITGSRVSMRLTTTINAATVKSTINDELPVLELLDQIFGWASAYA